MTKTGFDCVGGDRSSCSSSGNSCETTKRVMLTLENHGFYPVISKKQRLTQNQTHTHTHWSHVNTTSSHTHTSTVSPLRTMWPNLSYRWTAVRRRKHSNANYTNVWNTNSCSGRTPASSWQRTATIKCPDPICQQPASTRAEQEKGKKKSLRRVWTRRCQLKTVDMRLIMRTDHYL